MQPAVSYRWGCPAEISKVSNFFTVGRIYENKCCKWIDAILYVVLKFQVNCSGLHGGEASTDFGGNALWNGVEVSKEGNNGASAVALGCLLYTDTVNADN